MASERTFRGTTRLGIGRAMMTIKQTKLSLLGIAIASSMGIGALMGFWAPDDDLFEMRKGYRIFGAVYEKVVTGYVKPVDPGRLMRVGIEAMLDELDPYTVYIDESENARLDVITEGRYGGVGLEVGRRAGKIMVIAPVAGASGYEQGVRTGDAITEIAGQSTRNLSVDDVKTLLRGAPGTTVQITVEREGAPAPLAFTLTREQIELPDVAYQGVIGASDAVGYIRLERFTRDAADAMASALKDFRDQEQLRGVVLDLRDNPGGLLQAAVRVTALFVPQETVVVSTRGRRDAVQNTFSTERAPLLPEVPLVVIVNGQSASASEIVAGAMQDHDRGVILGTRTYGKGLVQNVKSLPHNTSLKLTTAQYYTPSGRTIQALNVNARDTSAKGPRGQSQDTDHGRTVRDGDGIRPDVRVPASPASPLEAALSRRAAFFRYANHYAATHDTLAADFSLTDSDLKTFRRWLDQEGIQYPTEAERALDSLQARLRTSGDEDVRDQAAALDTALQNAKRAGFDEHASALKQRLKREILPRYVSADRWRAALLPTDKQVQAAMDLLRQPDRYQSLLTSSDPE